MGRGVGEKRSWELKIRKLKLKMVEDNDKGISQKNRTKKQTKQEFQFCKMKRVFEIGCITMSINLTLLNCTLKNG